MIFLGLMLCHIIVFQIIDVLVSGARRVVRSVDPFCDVYDVPQNGATIVACLGNRTDVTRGIMLTSICFVSKVKQKTEIVSKSWGRT